MKEEQRLQEAAYMVALRKADVSFLAEGTIREEIIPALVQAGVDPESITSVTEQKGALFTLGQDEKMHSAVITRYSEFEYLGYYLGNGYDYRSSVGLLKGRGLETGRDCLYGLVLVGVEGRDKLEKCYYLLATATHQNI